MKRISAEVWTALTGWGLSLFYFWPGLMSNDSVAQLYMARSGAYGNWHPPSMSLIWGVLDHIVSGPAGMLLLQMTLIWVAYVSVSRNMVERPQRRWVFVLLVAICPALFLHTGVIWKDVQMSMALLCAVAILFQERPQTKWLVVAAGFLIYATTVRHNAAVACIPLWALLISKRVSWNWMKLGLAGFGATVFVFFVANALIGWATSVEERYPIQQILVHDITAISLAQKTNYLPVALDPEKSRTVEEIEKLYTPRDVVSLYCCDGAPFRLKMITDPKPMEEVKHAWWATVTPSLGDYLSHRFLTLSHLAGMGEVACNPFHRGIVPNSMGLSMGPNKVRDAIENVFWKNRNGLLFRAWPFLVLLLVQLFFFRRRGFADQAFLLSGVLYFLPYLFVATTCDFRMSHWSAQVAWMATMASLCRWKRG